MRRAERVSSLVCTVVCLRARLLDTACLQNCFVDNDACVHGGSMSDQRFPMRPRSLPLHGAIFSPLRCNLPGLWPRASAAWTVRVEVDWRGNNHWRLGPLLRS